MTPTPHLREAQLRAFIDGQVGDDDAAAMASHLDVCGPCAARFSSMDPLESAFVGVIAPVAPVGLVRAVLAEVEAPEAQGSWVEIGVGVALLLASLVLTGWGADPVRLLVQVTHAYRALDQGIAASGVGAAWVVSAGALFAGGLLVAMVGPERAPWLRALDRRPA